MEVVRKIRPIQAGFQIDALSSYADWLIFLMKRFDWSGVPTIKHHFEKPSEQTNKTKNYRISRLSLLIVITFMVFMQYPFTQMLLNGQKI